MRRFGLTPEQFGENLRDNYQRHEVEQDPAEPKELADEYIKGFVCLGCNSTFACIFSNQMLVCIVVQVIVYHIAAMFVV